MDDPDLRNHAELWEALTGTMHPSFVEILTQAQGIRQWVSQAPQLSAEERTALLAHLNALETTASRLVKLTASPPDPTKGD